MHANAPTFPESEDENVLDDPDAAFQARIAKGLEELERRDRQTQAYYAGMLDGPEPPLNY